MRRLKSFETRLCSLRGRLHEHSTCNDWLAPESMPGWQGEAPLRVQCGGCCCGGWGQHASSGDHRLFTRTAQV
jgi:hypothetical protein